MALSVRSSALEPIKTKGRIFRQEKASHQIITDNKKRILAVDPVHHGRKYDKRIYDETRVDKPPDVLTLGDLGCLGTALEIPLKASKKTPLTKQEKDDNTWHAKLRIGVEHGIGRMKKLKVFADIHRNKARLVLLILRSLNSP